MLLKFIREVCISCSIILFTTSVVKAQPEVQTENVIQILEDSEEFKQDSSVQTNKEESSIQELKKEFLVVSVLDTALTEYILNSGIGYEGNPIGFAGATTAKAILYFFSEEISKATNSDEKTLIEFANATISGASLNNALVIAGVSTAVSITSGIALIIYLLNF